MASETNMQDKYPNYARYDYYRYIRVNLDNEEQVKVFQELEEKSDSCTFIGHARHSGQKLNILIAAHKIADVADICDRYNVTHQILSYNFQEKIDDQLRSVKPKDTTGAEMDWDHYFHLNTIYDWMDKIVADNSTVLSTIELGKSFEGRLIRGVKLSRKPGNTAIFIEGGIHAREWISPSTVTFILNQLLTSIDPKVRDISENFDWIIFPIVNPDGYIYTFEGDRLWRKSRKPYGICRGVDLNRNFDCHWNSIGSSADPCRYDFCGSGPNSEPEAALITKYVMEHKENIKTYVAMHSHSQLLMFPFGHTAEKPSNYDDLLSIGKKGIEALEKRYGTKYKTGSLHEVIYPSSGGSKDWAYSVADIKLTFTFELRGPQDSTDMFILPADQITPVGWETLDAYVAMLLEARRLGYYN